MRETVEQMTEDAAAGLNSHQPWKRCLKLHQNQNLRLYLGQGRVWLQKSFPKLNMIASQCRNNSGFIQIMKNVEGTAMSAEQ